MRPLPLLGLVAGLACLGWGGYSLYGRFVGGPETYWDREKARSLAEMERALADMKELLASEKEQVPDLRRQLEAMPAGPKRDDLTKRLDELAEDATVHEEVVAKSEAVLETSRSLRDEARGRALRRGILFTLLGLVWTARAGTAVVRPRSRPGPSTAAPGPSPP